ncbi:kinase-like domain-containing protein [Chytridium lagenaria]|nr:kinase-like domain-containing protein [Chytridium lagenaria]
MNDEELAELRAGGSGEPGSSTGTPQNSEGMPVIVDKHKETIAPVIRVKPPPIQTLPPTSISDASANSLMVAPAMSRQRSTPTLPVKQGTGLDRANSLRASRGMGIITNPGGPFDNINLRRYARVYFGQYTVTNPNSKEVPPAKPTPLPDNLMDTSDDTPKTAYPQSTTSSSSLSLSAPSPNINSAPSSSTPQAHPAPPTAFIPCAVKRMHNTPESQSVGLAELFILRRIGHHPNIVRFIGAKDETDVDSLTVKNRIRSASLSTNGQPLPSAATSAASTVRTPTSPQEISTLFGLDTSPRLLLLLGYEPGGTMWDYIEEHKEVGIGHEMWARWAGQLAQAVEYIHSFGIIHHDIKPHNCLLAENFDAKLADFGNASFVPACVSPTALTDPVLGPAPSTLSASFPSSSMSSLRDGLGRGTQAYSAPELFIMTGPDPGVYSFPIDIYSVGVTLYVMATGIEPFQAARSSVHMMMAIKKGFWASGMQPGISTQGPILASSALPGGESPRRAAASSTTTDDARSAGRSTFLSTPIERGGHGFLKFGNGDRLHETAVRILCACVEKEPEMRPSATELVARIKDWVIGVVA